MNLDFGILWIEDSYSNEEEANLVRRVADAGFIARIVTLPNSVGIDRHAKDHGLYHCYDLILLDYRLQDENGNELAPKVRELFPSTTILFYSGSAPEQELRRMIAEKRVEGVYCSARSRFIERTGSLIEQTARALDRLSGMRGLAMRVVAECDMLMKNAVLSMSSRHQRCTDQLKKLDEDVLGHIDALRKAYEEATAGDLEHRIATRAVDSAKLYDHFRRLTKIVTADAQAFGLNEGQVEQLRALRRASAGYAKAVLEKRNVLGHVVEVPGPNGWVLQGKDAISVKDFPGMRGVFATHISAFRDMCELVNRKDLGQAE